MQANYEPDLTHVFGLRRRRAQGAKPKAEVIADVLASIRERRA
jgi:hypothetical protein